MFSQLEEEKKKSVDAQRRHQEEALAAAAAEAARHTEMAAAASAKAAAADAVREAVEVAEQEEFKRKAQKLKAGGNVVLRRSFHSLRDINGYYKYYVALAVVLVGATAGVVLV